MKCFCLKMKVIGYVMRESPKCPWDWRGSGCYDIPYRATQEADVTIVAETEAEAKNAAEEYVYLNSEMEKIKDVQVEKVEVSDNIDEDEPAGIAEDCTGFGEILVEDED